MTPPSERVLSMLIIIINKYDSKDFNRSEHALDARSQETNEFGTMIVSK